MGMGWEGSIAGWPERRSLSAQHAIVWGAPRDGDIGVLQWRQRPVSQYMDMGPRRECLGSSGRMDDDLDNYYRSSFLAKAAWVVTSRSHTFARRIANTPASRSVLLAACNCASMVPCRTAGQPWLGGRGGGTAGNPSPTLAVHGEGHGEGILIGLFNSKSTSILVGLFNSNFLKRPPGLDRA